MIERPRKKALWNEAMVTGLLLGGICIAYVLLNLLTAKLGGMVGMMLNSVLWLAKFLGCIWMMRYMMIRLTVKYPGADNRDTRAFGIYSAFLSAIIVAAVSMANMMLVSPDQLADAMNMAMSQYSGMIDSNTRDAMEQMTGRLPAISFFSNLIYCTLYGTVLSMILSSGIPSRNPFDRQDDIDNQ